MTTGSPVPSPTRALQLRLLSLPLTPTSCLLSDKFLPAYLPMSPSSTHWHTCFHTFLIRNLHVHFDARPHLFTCVRLSRACPYNSLTNACTYVPKQCQQPPQCLSWSGPPQAKHIPHNCPHAHTSVNNPHAGLRELFPLIASSPVTDLPTSQNSPCHHGCHHG